jgi:hypothetical protein
MNMMKIALLGTAAVAAFSVSARADELSDLKAQIEALNARVAQVETAPAVPAGYQLLSISSRDAQKIGLDIEKGVDRESVISIMPTADVPAGPELSISGHARAAIVYQDKPGSTGVGGDDELDIYSRYGVTVGGTTDTAVGKIGAKGTILQVYDVVAGSISTAADGYWGYWNISDELTLGGGRDGSLAGLDGSNACTCMYAGYDLGFGRGDPSQMRLSYESGPVKFAIALEDASRSSSTDDALGVAAEMKWSGDAISFEIAGGAWDNDDFGAIEVPAVVDDPATAADETAAAVTGVDAASWQVGAGVGFSMDMVSIKAAAAIGEMWSGDDYWKTSALASLSMSDSTSFELGLGYQEVEGASEMRALAGIYYAPVDKLTIGLEAGWKDPEGSKNNSMNAALVTVYKF